MYLYDSSGKKIRYNTSNKIGKGLFCDDVYRISDDVCLKVFKTIGDKISLDALATIKNLNLQNFYTIYDFLFNENGDFNGYTMKYYPSKTIDILTMPTSYTLDNFSGIYNSIITLTLNGIKVEDMNSNNVILDSSKMTVIDADLYCRIKYEGLIHYNMLALICLFKDLYFDALDNFHKDCDILTCGSTIRDLFDPNQSFNIDKVYKKLTRYKYPIDYIKSR